MIKIILTITQLKTLWSCIKTSITRDMMSPEDDQFFLDMMEKIAKIHDDNKDRKHGVLLFEFKDAKVLWNLVNTLVTEEIETNPSIVGHLCEILSAMAPEIDKQVEMNRSPLTLIK